MTRLTARRVSGAEAEAFDNLARREGELFQQPEWIRALGTFAERIGILDEAGVLTAGFVLRTQRRYGVEVLRNPPFTPSIGPFYEKRATTETKRLEESRRVVDAVADFLEPGYRVSHVGLSPRVVDLLPFRWRNFRAVVEYTYRLDLEELGPDPLSKCDGKVRNDVRKARRDGLEVTVGREFREVGHLEAAALRRDGAAGVESLEAVLGFAESWKSAFTTCVRRGGEMLAGSLVLGHGPIAYYIMGGFASGSDGRTHHGAGPLALQSAIEHARSTGYRVFDFEGSTLPRVEPFIRGFGGTLTPYYSASKAWLPLELLLKSRWRKHF